MIDRRLQLGILSLLCFSFIAGCGPAKEPGRYYGKGYSVKVPEDWQKANLAPGSSFAKMNKEGTITLNIASQKLPDDVTLEKVVEVTQSRSRAGGIAVTNSQEAMVGDTLGHLTEKRLRAMGKEFIVLEYHVVKDHVGYSVVFTIDAQAQEQRGDIGSVVQSLRFE